MKTKNQTADKSAKAEKPRAERERQTRLLIIITCIGVSAFAVVPFFFMGDSPQSEGLQLQMSITHDMYLHYDQMKSFHKGLSSGEIYPRWEEDTNLGFGAPTTQYYPPGIYYLTSALYLMTGDWTRSLMNTHLLLMIASAAGLYLYARRAMSRGAALVAMVSYIFLPYHLTDQYQRGAIAELVGFVWMPLVLLFAEKVLSISKDGSPIDPGGGRARLTVMLMSGAGLAASLGAFLWSHPPTAYQFLLAFGLFTVIAVWRRRDLKGLIAVGAASVLGLMLSAAYLYPAAVEQTLIQNEYVDGSWPYHETYVFVHNMPYKQFFLDFFPLIDAVWIFGAVTVALAAVVLLVARRNMYESIPGLRERVLLWSVIGVLAIFFMTKASYPIGRFIPRIEIGVFAWRMLSITTLVSALLAGACTEAAIRSSKRADGLLAASVAGLIMIGGIIFSISSVITRPMGAPVFVPEAEHFNSSMVPRTAPKNPRELPKVEAVELAKGEGKAWVEKWGPEHRVIRAELSGGDKLLIRTFIFPGWRVTVDQESGRVTEGEALRVEFKDSGQALIRAFTYRGGNPIVYGEETKVVGREALGDMVIELPSGSHEVRLDYEDTGPRRAGNLVSVVSFVVLMAAIATALVLRRRTKQAEAGSTQDRPGIVDSMVS